MTSVCEWKYNVYMTHLSKDARGDMIAGVL